MRVEAVKHGLVAIYLAADNHLHELRWTHGRGWSVGALRATPGAQPVATVPQGYVQAPQVGD